LSNTGLQAPADSRCPGDVVGGRVEEVERAVETGALEQRLLEQVRWRVHVHVVGQLARLPLAQTYYYYYYYYYYCFITQYIQFNTHIQSYTQMHPLKTQKDLKNSKNGKKEQNWYTAARASHTTILLLKRRVVTH